VVFYGNASNTNIQADPAGINFGDFFGTRAVNRTQDRMSYFGFSGGYFTRGLDQVGPVGGGITGMYRSSGGVLRYGAVAGDQNYANMSFNGGDGVFEAVAQFFFNGTGGAYLMAIATTNAIPNPQNLSAVGGPALSISAGKAMINAAAIPEPSSLVLLALGATGLAARRQRKKAA
jgi:hypothetical protein